MLKLQVLFSVYEDVTKKGDINKLTTIKAKEILWFCIHGANNFANRVNISCVI